MCVLNIRGIIRCISACIGTCIGVAWSGYALAAPLGLPPLERHSSGAEIRLGEKLFFDRRLSINGTLSCAMCHIPAQGFTQNHLATSVGLEGKVLRRNASTLLNVAWRSVLFHDGREFTLEHQVWSPLLNAREMGNLSIGMVLERLRRLDDYAARFSEIYEAGITVESIGSALAAYERTLIAANSPFDQWYFGGNEDAVNDAVKRGFELFNRHGCSACHTVGTGHGHFTDDAFYNTGVGYRRSMADDPVRKTVRLTEDVVIETDVTFKSKRLNDLGRYEVTGNPADRWKYRTPTLRNVELTSPYMHDGSIGTLEGVITFYMAGGIPNPLQDPRIAPFELDKRHIAGIGRIHPIRARARINGVRIAVPRIRRCAANNSARVGTCN